MYCYESLLSSRMISSIMVIPAIPHARPQPRLPRRSAPPPPRLPPALPTRSSNLSGQPSGKSSPLSSEPTWISREPTARTQMRGVSVACAVPTPRAPSTGRQQSTSRSAVAPPRRIPRRARNLLSLSRLPGSAPHIRMVMTARRFEVPSSSTRSPT